MTRRAWPYHDDGNATLPVAILDTGSKRLAIAVIVADFVGDTVCPHGQRCIDLLGTAANGNGLFGRLHKIEIATEAGAASRVEMAIACADDGDSIILMCADNPTFDNAWRCLDVRKWP